MNVRIYNSVKNAMQSGRAGTGAWTLEYERETPRHPESLMGWSSAADTCNQVKLTFPTMAEAVSYAEEHGWVYDLRQNQSKRIRPRNYGDNFRYFPPED
ncbi:MAG: ETC complex I subunit [Rhodospirillales bacterium]|nr:ETC complex I subunit [Rhodospirillales bacterium]